MRSFLSVLFTVVVFQLSAQNPFITNQFTADPSARIFNDRIYVFPSHDIPCTEDRGRPGWFCMEDYHVFSSDNLVDWKDHGVIVSQYDVPWANTETYSMWAPDAFERNGKYYFYFPTIIKDTTKYWRGYGIGVATANQPEGPYSVQPDPIDKVRGIDPNVFMDKDGQAYLYWSSRHIYGAKLKENMMELDGDPVIIGELPPVDKGLKEGPWVFERNGIYYMTYPHVENKTERLEYAIGDNPLGPFEIKGVIMDEWANGCWTNHHSIMEWKDQWYLFYHHNDLSPDFDKNRSIRIDSLFFNEDGTIQKVEPTLRGVGLTKATDEIQIDRFSNKSAGAEIDFLDSTNRFAGWKINLNQEGEWVQYNAVEFNNETKLSARLKSSKPATISVTINGEQAGVLAFTSLAEWASIEVPLTQTTKGIHNIRLDLKTDGQVEIDWVQFE